MQKANIYSTLFFEFSGWFVTFFSITPDVKTENKNQGGINIRLSHNILMSYHYAQRISVDNKK